MDIFSPGFDTWEPWTVLMIYYVVIQVLKIRYTISTSPLKYVMGEGKTLYGAPLIKYITPLSIVDVTLLYVIAQ